MIIYQNLEMKNSEVEKSPESHLTLTYCHKFKSEHLLININGKRHILSLFFSKCSLIIYYVHRRVCVFISLLETRSITR